MDFFVQLKDGTQSPVYSVNELEGADKNREIILCVSCQKGYFGHYVGMNNDLIVIDTPVGGKLIIPSNLVFGWFYKVD